VSTDISHLKHQVTVGEIAWWDAEDWCEENIGPHIETWYKLGIDIAAATSDDKSTTWYFKDQQQLTIFLLRWA